MSEYKHQTGQPDEFEELNILVFGETANDEDHELLQSVAQSLLDSYGEREIWGHYGFKSDTGKIIFAVSDLPDDPSIGRCVSLKISESITDEDDDDIELFSLTLGRDNKVIESYLKKSNAQGDIYQKITGIIMDTVHTSQPPGHVVDLLGHVLLLGSAEQDVTIDNFWHVPLSNGNLTKPAFEILSEFVDEIVDIRIGEIEFSVSDKDTETVVRSYYGVGNISEDVFDEVNPRLEVIHRDRLLFEEYRYCVFGDGEIEYIELDPRHEDNADIMTSSESIEEEQAVDCEVADILESTGVFVLSKEACNKLMRVLINISLNYKEDGSELD